MANINSIDAAGECPFDFGLWGNEDLSDKDIQEIESFMCLLQMPLTGYKLKYDNKGSHYIPSKHGGQLRMIPFYLSGQEAMWGSRLQTIFKLLKKAGWTFDYAIITDVDNNFTWHLDPDTLEVMRPADEDEE